MPTTLAYITQRVGMANDREMESDIQYFLFSVFQNAHRTLTREKVSFVTTKGRDRMPHSTPASVLI